MSKSGRTLRKPRVKAAIEITKHGAEEERSDLRDAYENLAARSMTEDGRDQNYEEYARRLSQLDSGDLEVLRCIEGRTMPQFERHKVLEFQDLSVLRHSADTTVFEFLACIDRLEFNSLLQVNTSDRTSGRLSVRNPGVWSIDGVNYVDLRSFYAIITPLASALLEHVADLETLESG